MLAYVGPTEGSSAEASLAATPRPRRGFSAEARRRRGRGADLPRRRVSRPRPRTNETGSLAQAALAARGARAVEVLLAETLEKGRGRLDATADARWRDDWDWEGFFDPTESVSPAPARCVGRGEEVFYDDDDAPGDDDDDEPVENRAVELAHYGLSKAGGASLPGVLQAAALRNLERVSVRSCGLDDAALEAAVTCLGKPEFMSLAALDLGGNAGGPRVADALMKLIKKKGACPMLSELDLSGPPCRSGADASRGSPTLQEGRRNGPRRSLRIERKDGARAGLGLKAAGVSLLEALGGFGDPDVPWRPPPPIERLLLSRNGLRGDAADAASILIRRNERIRFLDVTWNAFAAASGAAIIEALATAPMLDVLVVDERCVPRRAKRVVSTAAAAAARAVQRRRATEGVPLRRSDHVVPDRFHARVEDGVATIARRPT